MTIRPAARGWPLRRQAAMGLRAAAAPVLLFIPLGALLGPQGLGVLSTDALGYFDAVVSLALATLGVFIGTAAGDDRRATVRLAAAATLEAAVTMATVGVTLLVLLRAWHIPLALGVSLTALVLAVCAAASAAPPVDGADLTTRTAARVADLDDVLPIVIGSLAVSAISRADSALVPLVVTLGGGLAAGVAGWLLIERSRGAERGVFVLGTLALLAGCAAYAGGSPLLSGMIAGYFWARTPGRCDIVIVQEISKVQHPLVVLVLFMAGASVVPTAVGVWLLVPYVAFRMAGKFLGGWAACRLARGIAPADLGAHLVPPGVIGVAFALNVQQVAPAAAGPLVFAVSIGAIASEMLAMVVAPVPQTS